MEEFIQLTNFENLPDTIVIQNMDKDEQMAQCKSVLRPVILSAYLRDFIKRLPDETIYSNEGVKIYYNLFTILDLVDSYRQANYRWNAQDERGLQTTKEMVEVWRKMLEKNLKITIPKNAIFKKTLLNNG